MLSSIHNHRRHFSVIVGSVWLISVGLVCYLSLKPRVEFPLAFRSSDLIYHFLAYLWLSTLPFFGVKEVRIASMCALTMIALGIGLEFVQSFIPGRFLSMTDMIANALGVTLGLLFGRLLMPYFSR
jgi:VanZ family protein